MIFCIQFFTNFIFSPTNLNKHANFIRWTLEIKRFPPESVAGREEKQTFFQFNNFIFALRARNYILVPILISNLCRCFFLFSASCHFSLYQLISNRQKTGGWLKTKWKILENAYSIYLHHLKICIWHFTGSCSHEVVLLKHLAKNNAYR